MALPLALLYLEMLPSPCPTHADITTLIPIRKGQITTPKPNTLVLI